MTESSATSESIRSSFRVIFRTLDKLVLQRFVELGLTMPQFKALIAVHNSGDDGISVTQLGTELSVGQPSASLIVDQLTRPGYVERVQDVTDRRRVLVKLTSLGLQLSTELRLGRRAVFYSWLEALAEEDAMMLDRGMHALAEMVSAHPKGLNPAE